MGDNVVLGQIRRCNRNLLLANIALLAVVMIAAGATLRFGHEVVLGPDMLRADSAPTLLIEAVLSGLALWNLVLFALRDRDPSQHPIMRFLSRYGTPERIARQIDAEARSAGERIGWGRTLLTHSWLLHPTLFGVHVVRLVDLVWVYGKAKARGILDPASPVSWVAVLVAREGKPVEIVGTAQDMADLTISIHSRAPWAFTGYNETMALQWRKHRDAIIAEVNRRQARERACARSRARRT